MCVPPPLWCCCLHCVNLHVLPHSCLKVLPAFKSMQNSSTGCCVLRPTLHRGMTVTTVTLTGGRGSPGSENGRHSLVTRPKRKQYSCMLGSARSPNCTRRLFELRVERSRNEICMQEHYWRRTRHDFQAKKRFGQQRLST